MPTNRIKLSDILHGQSDDLRRRWDETQAAGEFEPLPAGTYIGHVQAVELFNAKTGTPGVQIRFKLAEGEHAGRMVFHDCWLTEAALPQTKRDCAKLGLVRLEQLENAQVQPGRIRCRLKVALRTDDNGEQRNRLRSFEVIGIDEPQADAFAPATASPDSDAPGAAAEPEAGDGSDAADSTDTAEDDVSFNFGAGGAA